MMNNDGPPLELTVDGKMILLQDTTKVLGILFDSSLKWDHQVKSIVSKTNRMFHGMKKLRRFVNAMQAKTMITAFYFSVLYYGSLYTCIDCF